jgi:hypothetical protein
MPVAPDLSSDLKSLSRPADYESMARPQDPKVKEAIAAALLAACRSGDLAIPEGDAALSDAWDNALSAAFDAARPPGRFESWARESLPKVAGCIHVAKIETTSPKRTDAIELSAVAIFEMRLLELHANRDGTGKSGNQPYL